ncbi:hypothetical protein FUA26_06990 [Seonamhaeicola algicola]|uniref:Uncharacterized protein n=1 Tax=Seonamhaeicola algicola TaxID=1719036 RepID=A0A5C7AVU5_9FLAO|nr:hypothetical protein [Seonamhaeicola algicola]TXE11803.1 hypothetical protein FUA26_06990 [Seonamhaeicola algicola]
MRHIFLVLFSLCLTTIYSCDDGDVITVSLDFEDTFQACNGVSGIVLYKTKNDPSESLSVFISNYTVDAMLNVGDDNTFEETKTGTFNYRTYNNATISGGDLFCNDVPPSDVEIRSDDQSACSVFFRTVLTEDDNDGVPTELENPDPNGDGIFDDAQDTDGDSIPDYIDFDDDGDNVPTANENPDPNGDGDLSDAQDTDGDGIPDYLDDDDDGDGTLTRDEEKGVQDQNPTNDETNEAVGPDYLNPDVSDVLPATAYRQHSYTKAFLVTATILNLDLSNLTQDELFFGNLTGDSKTSKTETLTPNFN